MPFQFLDLVLAACAALGQILSGVDGGTTAINCVPEKAVQSSDPNERIEVMMNQSEDIGQLIGCHRYWRGFLTWGWHWSDETRQLTWAWHYYWAVPHLTYQRVDGGIGP
jgi:hypothetical protein